MKLENNFRKQLTKAIKKNFGGLAYVQKNHGSVFSSGLVDLEVILKGAVYFAELKATEERFDWKNLTELQLETLRQITGAGGVGMVLVYFKRPDVVVRVAYEECLMYHRRQAIQDADFLLNCGHLVLDRTEALENALYLNMLFKGTGHNR